jgi:hypothetical protein
LRAALLFPDAASERTEVLGLAIIELSEGKPGFIAITPPARDANGDCLALGRRLL